MSEQLFKNSISFHYLSHQRAMSFFAAARRGDLVAVQAAVNSGRSVNEKFQVDFSTIALRLQGGQELASFRMPRRQCSTG